jgi:multimeric flavodoxin WrbA
MKHLLVVYHSQTGNTAALAQAVLRGASSDQIEGVRVRLRRASEAGSQDMLWCHAVVLGTPENFGYMSGALKDFMDRTFYPSQGRVDGLPFAMFVSAGNDGSGALRAIRRIASGYPLKEVQAPIIVRGPPSTADVDQCEELGMAMAAGLELGVF